MSENKKAPPLVRLGVGRDGLAAGTLKAESIQGAGERHGQEEGNDEETKQDDVVANERDLAQNAESDDASADRHLKGVALDGFV